MFSHKHTQPIRYPRANRAICLKNYDSQLMAEKSTEASPYSQLQALTVTDVQFTGVDLGRGAYGTVSEVKLAGALCAAKQIHEELLQASKVGAIVKQFVSECMLLSSLHHPNIVQFFGVCSVEKNK